MPHLGAVSHVGINGSARDNRPKHVRSQMPANVGLRCESPVLAVLFADWWRGFQRQICSPMAGSGGERILTTASSEWYGQPSDVWSAPCASQEGNAPKAFTGPASRVSEGNN